MLKTALRPCGRPRWRVGWHDERHVPARLAVRRQGSTNASSTSSTKKGSNVWLVLVTAAAAGATLGALTIESLSEEQEGKGPVTHLLGRLSGGKAPDLHGYLNELRKARFRDDQMTTDETELVTHGHSPWSYHPAHNPSAVVYPATVEQAQAIVQQAPVHGIVLVPFAGGTSLEAHWAAPPDHPGIRRKVVSVDFALMDKIGKCNIADGDIEVEAGVKYDDLNEHLKEQGIDLFFPVDPGPGAALGGMMATGGSGTNAVRYGTMRGDYIINATVVLPNGEVITTRSRSRKSSVGPDLTKLFLGSEGTMGLIVKARLRLAPVLPTSIVIVPFKSIHDACSAAQRIVSNGVGIQCIELLDDEMLKVINIANEKTYGKGAYMEQIEKPSLFIKLQGSQSHRREDENVVRKIAQSVGAHDREIRSSHEEGNNERLWRARKIALWSCMEAMPAREEYSNHAEGKSGWKAWTTDVSVPLGSMAALFEKVREDTRKTGLHAPIIGHIGDGGAHSIIMFKDDDPAEFKKVKAFVNRVRGTFGVARHAVRLTPFSFSLDRRLCTSNGRHLYVGARHRTRQTHVSRT